MKKLAVLVLILTSCQQEEIFTPFSGDQVEYMLTDGASKAWIRSEWSIDGQPQSLEGCGDTLFWILKISGDSAVGYEYKYDPVCTLYDTLYLGKMVSGSDSLNFLKEGETYFKKPGLVRPHTFSIGYSDSEHEYRYTFVTSEFGILSRQVSYFLTDGISAGDSLEWMLTSITIAGKKQSLTSCEDSTQWVFYRTPSSAIRLTQLTPVEGCLDYTSLDFGSVRVSDDRGFFDGLFYLEGGEIDTLVVSSFTQSSFSASYLNYAEDTTVYAVTFVAK